MTFVLIASAAISLLAVGVIGWYSRPAGRTRAAHHVARTVDLGLDPDVERSVAARLSRREVMGGVGGLVTMWGTVGLLAATTDVLEAAFAPLLVAVGYLLGHAVGYGVVAWDESRRPAAAGPRIARASSPGHGDYVARHERWGAWAAAGVATLVAAGFVVLDLVLGVPEMPWPLVVATAVLPWLAIGLDEALARRLLDRRQVASTTLELAWDDAMRARTLRDMVTVPLVLGLYLPLVLTGVIADASEGGWPANPMVGITSGVFLGVLGGACLMGAISMALTPQRHFRTRLWPRPVEQVAR
ncbi:hypothetical protein GXB85_14660 [Cellulomonas sp. APG4]|uniref:hypothetical protein n=1 Tax=Cellulomonas sp. APG4 TaxID=1538656 RepID=UPI00137989F8|nr:hypothetical protein [Cellulomonas sp. APG4]NCT92183.1 hypothetical protein [Cellulomonas sp. APG4]